MSLRLPEQKLWDHLRDAIGGAWDADRIESPMNDGVPDVAYSTTHHGWIELKVVEKRPKAGQIVRVPHYTAGQRNFATRHGRRGGRCFLLLQIESTYMLFGWRSAFKIGELTLPELAQEALLICGNGIVADAFLDALEGVVPSRRG